MREQLVSLIIPVYNESHHLLSFLKEIDNCELSCPKELIIIDDCSSDNSAQIIQNYKFNSNFIFLRQPKNSGKGAAIKLGIENAKGNIIGVQDADFEYLLSDINSLIQPILRNEADVVFGSRFKKNGSQVHRTFHYFVNRCLTILSNIFSGIYLTDMETCYKFFKSSVIKNIEIESKRFGFEPEITAKISHLKVRIIEKTISYYPRNYLEGKKITYRDGIAAIWHILYFNLFAKDFIKPTMPKKFISHASLKSKLSGVLSGTKS